MSDPWDEFRERMRGDPFIGPFFNDIDREFERIQETFQHMLNEATKAGEQAREGKPFVYGFSFKMGPDGRPVFQDFGNAKPSVRPGLEADLEEGARAPLVDVIASDERVTVTAELPGVDKKDIKLRATEDALIISVAGDTRRYYKRVQLPAPVKPDTTKATYKNGVLDVEVDRATADEDEGTEVSVE